MLVAFGTGSDRARMSACCPELARALNAIQPSEES